MSPLPPDFSFNPFPTLHTDRLVMRAITLEDALVLFRLRSDEEVMKYVGRPRMNSMEEAEKMIENLLKMQEDVVAINWVLSEKGSPKMIGNIGFWQWQKDHFRAEVGYMLDPAHQGKGFMLEAMAAALEFGRKNMHLHSVEARVNPLNKASCRTLEKSGFLQEGYQRESFFWNGVFEDTALFGLVFR